MVTIFTEQTSKQMKSYTINIETKDSVNSTFTVKADNRKEAIDKGRFNKRQEGIKGAVKCRLVK